MKTRWKMGYIMILILVSVCTIRIWNVNHSDLVEKHKAETKIYPEGTTVELSNATYYLDVAQLEGYHMKVTESRILETREFLDQYGMTVQELEKISKDEFFDFTKVGLINLVKAEFYNDNWEKESGSPVLLDNFLLVGDDYYFVPDTMSINMIEEFNPELKNNPAFFIQSNRTLEIIIPYAICTEGETGVSLSDLLEDELKLLITTYPKEIYLKIPKPILS